MTVRNYYRWSLALPILLPLIEIGIRWQSGGFHTDIYPYLSVLALSLVFGGIPYVFVAAILLYRIRHKEDSEMLALALQAPLIMLPLQFLFSTFVQTNGNYKMGLVFAIYTVPIALAFGYAYVALAIMGQWLFRSLGLVTATETE